MMPDTAAPAVPHILILVCEAVVADAERAYVHARDLRAQGHHVTVLLPSAVAGHSPRPCASALGVKTFESEPIGVLFAALIGPGAPHIVQVIGTAPRNLAPVLLAKAFGKPVVIDCRGGAADKSAASAQLAKPLHDHIVLGGEALGLRLADAIIVPGESAADAIKADRQKITVLRDGPWHGLAIYPADRTPFANDRPHLVASLSDFDACDRVDFLLRTIRRVVFGLQRLDVQFAIAAPAARHARLIQMAQSEDVKAFVTLVDAQDLPAVSHLLSSADLVVDPAERNAHTDHYLAPFALCAAKFSVPLVAFDRRIIHEALAGLATIAQKQEVPALADAILDLLDFPEVLAARREDLRQRALGPTTRELSVNPYTELMDKLLPVQAPATQDAPGPSPGTAAE